VSGDAALHLAVRKTQIQLLDFLSVNNIGDYFDHNWRDQSIIDILYYQEGRRKRLY